MSTSSSQQLVGSELSAGRYHLVRQIGEGGMGAVYLARDNKLGNNVVIKIPHPAILRDPAFGRRFQEEIGSLVQLDHPNIVKVLDVGEHNGLPYAVMQFLSGGSLEDRRPRDINGQALPVAPTAVLPWLQAISRALDFVHQQGYLHRDIKPANILFDRHSSVYLSDFGIAKMIGRGGGNIADQAGITGQGLVLGTPEYMAPEIIQGEPADGRADQYSLAVVLYEVLGGRRPFQGSNPASVMIAACTHQPDPLSDLQPSVGSQLSSVIHQALSRSPQARYPTCTLFVAAYAAAIENGLSFANQPALSPSLQAKTAAPVAPAPPPVVSSHTRTESVLLSSAVTPVGVTVSTSPSRDSMLAKQLASHRRKMSVAKLWFVGCLLIATGILGVTIFRLGTAKTTQQSKYLRHPNSAAKAKASSPAPRPAAAPSQPFSPPVISGPSATNSPPSVPEGPRSLALPKPVLLLTCDTASQVKDEGQLTMKDMSEHGHICRLSGPSSAPGKVGEALDFDGNDDRVITDLPSKDVASFTAWLKVRHFDETFWIVNFVGPELGFTVRHDGKSPDKLSIFFPPDWRGASFFHGLEENTWQHIALVLDWERSSYKYFLNGKLHVSDVLPAGGNTSKGLLTISTAWQESAFPGLIDEFAVFDRPISADEVQAVFELGQRGQSLAGVGDEHPKGPGTVAESINNSIGMTLVAIAPGNFMRGNELPVEQLVAKYPGTDQSWFSANSPQHPVRISQSFYMSATEVTEGQFALFEKDAKYESELGARVGRKRLHDVPWKSEPNFPVVNVTWNDAGEFCKWLSLKERRRYRLPTDAEWEYACRAGTVTEWSMTDDPNQLPEYANISPESASRESGATKPRDIYPTIAPVGSFPPNAWGLYDTHGNVSEWVLDWADVDYRRYAEGTAVDPTGPVNGTRKLIRGGNWGESAVGVRSAITNAQFGTNNGSPRIGFRVVCEGK